MEKATCYIQIESRRMTTTGENKGKYHVKLWVNFKVFNNGVMERKRCSYKTNVYCTLEDFDLYQDRKAKRITVLIQDLRDRLDDIEKRARTIIEEMDVTTQEQFEVYFLSDYNVECVAIHIKEKIQELDEKKKISSKEKYGTTLYSLTEFFGNDKFTFNMLTPDTLQKYEDWYIEQDYGENKRSLTTVGIHMRNLRHIFNRAIKKGIIPVRIYPFQTNDVAYVGIADDLYLIPEGDGDGHGFLETEEKDLFLSWSTKNEKHMRLYEYAKYIYYSHGINVSDFARLKRNNVFDDHVSIFRQKSKGRKKKDKKMTIPMHPVMQQVIKKHSKRSLIPNDYVFPILDLNMDEKTMFYKIRDLVDDINDVLRIVSKELKLSIRVTTYVLRHSFSYQYIELGASTEELQDALAHGSAATTEVYKHGFSLKRKKKFSQGL